MKIPRMLCLAVLIIASCSAPPGREGDMDYVLDAGEEGKDRFLDTHFARYGYERNKSIIREPSGYRFVLPALPTGVEQTGVYSSFALAGDFEVAAVYQFISVAVPEKGYGVTCGIALDTEGPAGNISLTRGYQLGNISGYIVSRGRPTEAGMDYKSDDPAPSSSKALSGRLMVKRAKKDLVLLIANTSNAESLEELARIPFTDAIIKKVRFFADSGGSPTGMDARLVDIKIQAEEISGGVPKRSRSLRWGWGHTLAVVVVLGGAVLGVALYIRKRPKSLT